MTRSAAELAELLGLPRPTDEQREVIEAPLEPLLVVAGAGSGKTETMAARVVFLVANGLVDPANILGLTFTRKASVQLGERIRTRLRSLAAAAQTGRTELLPTSATPDDRLGSHAEGEPEVSTYHAFAGRLLGEYGPLVGIEPTARVLTATSMWQLARRVVGQWEGDLQTDKSPEQVTEILLALSGALSDHLVDVEQLRSHLADLERQLTQAPPSSRQKGALHSKLQPIVGWLQNRQWVVPLVAEFASVKRRAGVVDFADQMQLTAQLVTSSESVAAAVRDQYRVVLLDEYQDTGHAQRVILRALFGNGAGSGHPVTAVGDPVQSIYTWRGASASNLTRFGEDFALADGTQARRLTLLTSFRNPPEVLTLANAISDPVRRAVPGLRPAPGAAPGTVATALLPTLALENRWLADRLGEMWDAADAAGQPPPSTAILMRKRREMSDLAEVLRDRGIRVEVVGLGGLLDEPEVADLVAMLRLLVDPHAGSAALRILGGARWQLGMADLAALAARAGVLARRRWEPTADGVAAVRAALAEASGAEDGDDVPSLVDAIGDVGDPGAFSAAGYARLVALADELRRLRRRLGQPLPDLVLDIARTTGMDVEIAVAGPEGRAHLDAFAAVVGEFAAIGGGVPELLDYLATADEREDGLTPGEIDVVPGRVQILTVHAAKGLEWDVVAIPHLSQGVFPDSGKQTWLTDPAQLPPALRGDAGDVPVPPTPFAPDLDQGRLAAELGEHQLAYRDWQLTEERRLAYVAVTRAQRVLLLSGHHWGSTQVKPRGPSEFLTEAVEVLGLLEPPVVPQLWADPPEAGEVNPQTALPRSGSWPTDPHHRRRARLDAGAGAVLAAVARRDPASDPALPAQEDDPYGWAADVDVLLAERARGDDRRWEVSLPASLSVTSVVDLARDPAELARRLRRPVPMPPAPHARRGTAFHAWLEQLFAGDALLAVDELPGADDRDAAADHRLADLQAAFRGSSWAGRTPIRVEVPFTTRIGGLAVRGRMDAVFADSDGGFTVVDWKTGRPPTGAAARAAMFQLAAYRLAWADLAGVDVQKVRAAFHHVADDVTLQPADLADRDALDRLVLGWIEQSTAGSVGSPT
ncbi:ATP-dependent DNA helicase [Nakamurella sp. A5-74]|uniref:DNA 3'-5' helicase n=1 Tax=Nakamurella sp. A5-74 TaxID=3158264 RepID=A0AAU8DJ82_9ACTN